MNDIITVYHGTDTVIENPELGHSEKATDFGSGFYLTEDPDMAKKWAANNTPPIVNHYTLDLTGLKICHLKLDKVWLHYIAKNRGSLPRTIFNDEKYDVIIGPTADNRIGTVLKDYLRGKLSVDEALMYINGRNLSEQILLQTQKALNQVTFLGYNGLTPEESKFWKDESNREFAEAIKYISAEKSVKYKVEIPSFIDLDGYERI